MKTLSDGGGVRITLPPTISKTSSGKPRSTVRSTSSSGVAWRGQQAVNLKYGAVETRLEPRTTGARQDALAQIVPTSDVVERVERDADFLRREKDEVADATRGLDV
jgi:hypothetical protein